MFGFSAPGWEHFEVSAVGKVTLPQAQEKGCCQQLFSVPGEVFGVVELLSCGAASSELDWKREKCSKVESFSLHTGQRHRFGGSPRLQPTAACPEGKMRHFELRFACPGCVKESKTISGAEISSSPWGSGSWPADDFLGLEELPGYCPRGVKKKNPGS